MAIKAATTSIARVGLLELASPVKGTGLFVMTGALGAGVGTEVAGTSGCPSGASLTGGLVSVGAKGDVSIGGGLVTEGTGGGTDSTGGETGIDVSTGGTSGGLVAGGGDTAGGGETAGGEEMPGGTVEGTGGTPGGHVVVVTYVVLQYRN